MKILILILFISTPVFAFAKNIYQQPEEFINQAFSGKPPGAKIFVIGEDIKTHVYKIMEHQYPVSKVEYWRDDKRTVWILEEIGKYKPITTGIIVNDGEIEFLKVLIYRESHGWEVKHSFFTDQFKNVKLKNAKKLSHSIDNISGATMSVDALRNLTKLALFLHGKVINEK